MKKRDTITLLQGIMVIILLLTLSGNNKDRALGRDFDTVIDPDQYPGTSDFEKLQNALNGVPPYGANVIVPARVYQGSNLTVPSNVRILGKNGTTFKLSDNATIPFLVLEYDVNVAIENIVFDGNKGNITNDDVSLIHISQGCQEISIFNNTFVNFKSKAIAADSTKIGEYTRFITIHQNMFYDGEGAAMILKGVYHNETFFMEDVDIHENTLYNLTSNGKIGVAFTNRPRVRNNLIISCEASNSGNIVVRGCKDAYASHNSILNSRAIAGIYIEASIVFPNKGVFTIEINRVIGETGDGLSMTSSSGVEADIVVRKNYFNQNSGMDIEIPDVDAYVCENFVETSKDLSLPTDATAWGNRLLSGLQGYNFIEARTR